MMTRKQHEENDVTDRGARSFEETSHDVVFDEWSAAFQIASSKTSSWSISSSCRAAMELLLLSKDYDQLAALSVATEASSHPSGLNSLKSQPWVYSGGGLGNGDECKSLNFDRNNDRNNQVEFHCCISGVAANRAASLPFASLCIPSDCTAHDLASNQMLPILQQYLTVSPTTEWLQESQQLREEYVTIVERIHDINKFLGTGWVCGEFEMPWNPLAVLPFALLCLLLLICAVCATLKKDVTRHGPSVHRNSELTRLLDTTKRFWNGYEGEEKHVAERADEAIPISCYHATSSRGCASRTTTPSTASECSNDSIKQNNEERVDDELISESERNCRAWHWTFAFDMKVNLKRLMSVTDGRTACLDGLRVGSLLWILLGHVMAIESSTGAGYSNPAAFLPPNGWTTTITGQLLFSSRMAVDTFFCISGFLLIHVLDRKVNWAKQEWISLLCRTYPMLIVSRVVRILPVYAFCLFFYVHIAPHMGSGPFWYQWQGLLMPCQGIHWIRNLLFSNNLVDGPITESCFYHSWYLAVDMQLYAISLLLMLSMYNYDSRRYYEYRHKVIATLSIVSICATAYFTWTRRWSLNTFDGISVVRYDVEGYASPIVRAQSYLAGMLVACFVHLHGNEDHNMRAKHRRNLSLLVAILAMVFVVFITSVGAYAQRPCQYNEWPGYGRCGSIWSPLFTFLYTAFSRPIWNTGLCVLIYVCVTGSCLNDRGNPVASILSWRIWTLLSNLSFGAYLIHPIVIFIWQLGGRQKAIFSLLSFSMTNFSIAVTSFVASLVVALLVELPAARMWREMTS